jgi:hypothetical protein
MLLRHIQRRLFLPGWHSLPKGLKPLVIISIAPLGLVKKTFQKSSVVYWALHYVYYVLYCGFLKAKLFIRVDLWLHFILVNQL